MDAAVRPRRDTGNYSAPMAIPAPLPPRGLTPRIDVFDGIRGVAIVLVVLSHGWTIWPTSAINDRPLLRTVFTSGNYAVSVFFVVGAFLATQGMLRAVRSPEGLRPGVALLRRFVRLSGQVYFLLLVVALVTVLDTTDTYPDTETRTSILRIGSYTWNWYLQSHALVARPDLGHLWYLSVDMQAFVLILAVVYLLRRRPAWLLVALLSLLLACISWRTHVYQTEGLYQAMLRTTVRVDAPLTGASAAAAIPFLKRLEPRARLISGVSLVALVPLLYFNAPASGYFGWPGLLLDLSLAGFVIGCTVATPPRFVTASLGSRLLTYLGRRSLSLYLWHYPIFWFVSRHTYDWGWEARTLVALALTLAIAELSERLVESRVQKLLQSSAWKEMERGIPRYVGRQVKSRIPSRAGRSN